MSIVLEVLTESWIRAVHISLLLENCKKKSKVIISKKYPALDFVTLKALIDGAINCSCNCN